MHRHLARSVKCCEEKLWNTVIIKNRSFSGSLSKQVKMTQDVHLTGRNGSSFKNRSNFSSFENLQKVSKKKSRKTRIVMMREKEAALETLFESYSQSSADDNEADNDVVKNDSSVDANKSIDREKEREALFQEASFMTRSLYRTCVRCIRVLRPGNEYDEANFQRREEERVKEMESLMMGSGKSGSLEELGYEPAVDRENELSSRASYYFALIKESFNQEVDCLLANPWLEDNPHRFVYLMRQGEERRRWVLEDYKFDDPYLNHWDEARLIDFEKRSQQLVKDTYKDKGWSLKSEVDEALQTKDASGIWEEDYMDDEDDNEGGNFKP